MIPQYSPQHPEKYYNNTDIVHLTVKQIIKDFAMFGLDIHFSGNVAIAYPELMTQLTESLQTLLQHDSERLFALMYQIDISQSAVNECFRLNEHPTARLADLIIRREMMKVLTVKYYKELKKK